MKKTLLIAGAVLLAAGVICFGLSLLFRWAHGAMLDGSPEHYARLARQCRVFLYLGAGLSVPGAALLVLGILRK